MQALYNKGLNYGVDSAKAEQIALAGFDRAGSLYFNLTIFTAHACYSISGQGVISIAADHNTPGFALGYSNLLDIQPNNHATVSIYLVNASRVRPLWHIVADQNQVANLTAYGLNICLKGDGFLQ